MRGKKLSFTTRYVLLFGVLLFVASAALGLVVLSQSKDAMRTLINKNMLDIVKSAAGSLNGDVLGALKEDDVDGPVFCDIEDRLLVFQNSVDIHYIYAVKQVDEDTYVFTVDPDPVDPGAFGEEIVTTPALVAAAKGVPTADDSPAADRWGNFYSAYSPVFDSSGKVAGVVGVDFDASWYDGQITKYTVSIAAVTSLSVLLGSVVVMLISNRVRMRFRSLNAELSELSEGIDQLMGEMTSYTGSEVSENSSIDSGSATEEDELETLGRKIRTMQDEMGLYLDYLRIQAYTDSLTRVGSSTAYHELVNELNEKINGGTADFYVAVFDVNSLKQLNDTYGHECGDEYIKGTATALKEGFGDACIFRIGGDEFAVVAEGFEQAQMDEGLRGVATALAAFNESRHYDAVLAISQGVSHFEPETDSCFKDVFARADHAMYVSKREYYRTVGDRRSRS